MKMLESNGAQHGAPNCSCGRNTEAWQTERMVVFGLVPQHAATQKRSDNARTLEDLPLMKMFVFMYDNVCLQYDNVYL